MVLFSSMFHYNHKDDHAILSCLITIRDGQIRKDELNNKPGVGVYGYGRLRLQVSAWEAGRLVGVAGWGLGRLLACGRLKGYWVVDS